MNTYKLSIKATISIECDMEVTALDDAIALSFAETKFEDGLVIDTTNPQIDVDTLCWDLEKFQVEKTDES